MKKDDRVFLLHILDAILQIEHYVEHVGATEFLQTRLLQDGVVRQLEIIGEASRNLTDAIRLEYSDVPNYWVEKPYGTCLFFGEL